MAQTCDELIVNKELLESYFRVEDLQRVLKEFNLPFIGRKPELFQRVLSLINDRQYDSDFIAKVKTKISEIYRERLENDLNPLMAPTVNTSHRSTSKHRKGGKSTRYESDHSYSGTSVDLTDESESDFIVPSDTEPEVEDLSIEKPKKRKRVIESNSSSNESSSDSSLLNSYLTKSRNKRKKDLINREKKPKQKGEKEKKTKLKYISSSSSESEDSNTKSDNSSSDSGDSVVTKKTRKVMKKKIKVNMNLSSSDSETQINGTEIADDDEIQFLEFVPASQSTIVRTDHYRTKEDSSSDTESSLEDISSASDMDTNDSIMNEKANQLLTLVNTDSRESTLNITACDTRGDKTPEVQTPAIDSQNLDKTVSQNSGTIAENIIESNVANNLSPESNSIESIESPEVIAINVQNSIPNSPPIESLPKPVAPVVQVQVKAQPPQPQLPYTWVHAMSIHTPKGPNFPPKKRETKIVGGQAVVIEPPPPLPDWVQLQVIQPSVSINKIKRILNISSDGIEAIEQSLKISLNCPISNKRIGLPSRSKACNHIDCFDINSFLEINYNKKVDAWKCPKCTQSAKIEQLVIDSLIQHILFTTDTSVDTILFDNKAVWIPDIKRPEISVGNNSVINIDNQTEDVIDIDDDDDDDEPSPTVRESNSATSLERIYSQAMSSAKNVEQSVTNLIHTNQRQLRGNSEKQLSINKILQYLTNAEQEVLRPAPQTTTAPQQRNNSMVIRLNTPNTTQLQSIPPLFSNNINRSQNQNIVIRTSTLNPTQRPIQRPTANTSSGDFKFEFKDGKMKISCNRCKRFVGLTKPEMEEHLKSERHLNSLLPKSVAPNSGQTGTLSSGQTVRQISAQTVRPNSAQSVTQNVRPISGQQVPQQSRPLLTFQRISVPTAARNQTVMQSNNQTYGRNNNYNYTQPHYVPNTVNNSAYHPNQYTNQNHFATEHNSQSVPFDYYNQRLQNLIHYNQSLQTYQTLPAQPPPAIPPPAIPPPPAHLAPNVQYQTQQLPIPPSAHTTTTYIANPNQTYYYNNNYN